MAITEQDVRNLLAAAKKQREQLQKFADLDVTDVESLKILKEEINAEREKVAFLENNELDQEIDDFLDSVRKDDVVEGGDTTVENPPVDGSIGSSVETGNAPITDNSIPGEGTGSTDGSNVETPSDSLENVETPSENGPANLDVEGKRLPDGSVLKPDGSRIFADGTAIDAHGNRVSPPENQ